MVLVIDYGVGNLASFTKVLNHLAVPFTLSADPNDLRDAPMALLMGVGNFGSGMDELNKRGFTSAIRDYVKDPGRRLFGVCVGMQLLFEGSEEAPGVAGFGFFPGTLRKLKPRPDAPVPHVGFDEVRFATMSPMMAGLPDRTSFYFTHSFAVMAPPPNAWAATCLHGDMEFVVAVDNGQIGGVQFHPEKSQSNGIALLRNVTKAAQAIRP
jgi:imidazole glycerol phosphate synthase glutamine amidotransferase subunit